MGDAKAIQLRPISAQEANKLVRRVHYSGKVVNNSQLHIGVFYQGRLEGAMQFGPSLDKRKIMGLVEGTGWNEFIELNRMAFSDVLPRNSESRALGIAMKLLRKHAPQVKWVVTFADGTQCGDGTIYRAAGFVLTGIKKNNQIWGVSDGELPAKIARSSFAMQGNNGSTTQRRTVLNKFSMTQGKNICETGGSSMRSFIEAGYKPLDGFQLRYLGFIEPSARERLTVPVLPYSEIERRGAGMYKGEPRARSVDSDTPANHAGEDGAVPILALQTHESHGL